MCVYGCVCVCVCVCVGGGGGGFFLSKKMLKENPNTRLHWSCEEVSAGRSQRFEMTKHCLQTPWQKQSGVLSVWIETDTLVYCFGLTGYFWGCSRSFLISSLQFFSIALAHFSIHCWLFQSSSHTALNRSWNDQNTIWCLQNDTTFSKLITHPSKPNISIKTYNLCSIENVCFLIYITMDNKIQTAAININLWIHHLNFCATPSQYWLFYQWQHTTLGFVLSTLT